MNQTTEIYVITGAHDTGKSAVLEHLHKEFGYTAYEEALKFLRRELGEVIFYHNPAKPFVRNDSPDHVCPICRPKKLTSMLLNKQIEIERQIGSGTAIMERGFCDYANRELSEKSFTRYKLVFLMEIMPELQEPKFGKSVEQRIREAIEFNEYVFREYLQFGFRVVIIPRGTVAERADVIDSLIKRKGNVPFFGAVNSGVSDFDLLAEINSLVFAERQQLSRLLFRTTGAKHMLKVLKYGTDRAGFTKEINWAGERYYGKERKFEDIIYASRAEDILRKSSSTAFKKIPMTEDPYILVYDKNKLEPVHENNQYAFLDPGNKLDALICVLKVRGEPLTLR